MDLLNFFVFELYYTREFILNVLIQIQKTFKTSWKVIKNSSFNTVLRLLMSNL